jgi:hypothetical protein
MSRRDRVAALLRDDAAPEQVPEVRGERVERPLVVVEPQGVEAALVEPERLVEAPAQRGGLLLEPPGGRFVAPDLAGDLRHAQLRVVHVALHLHRRDRRLGQRAVVEGHRVR